MKENLACFLYHYFARDAVKLLLAVFFKGSLVEIFAEKVAKGNSVQNDPNFPAKSLTYTKNFSSHLVIDSIENYLINQLIIKENMKLLWITECILRDNKS